MLKNLKVGSKLIAVLLAPVLVLSVLAAIGVLDRRADAVAAADVETQANLVDRTSGLVHQLQVERLQSAIVLATAGASGVEDLAAVRKATDQAVKVVRSDIASFPADLRTRELQDSLAILESRLAELSAHRDEVDAGPGSPDPVLARYGEIVAVLLNLNAEVASDVSVPELSSAMTDFVALSRAKEAVGRLGVVLTAVGASGSIDTARFDVLARSLEEEDRALARFFESATAEQRTLVRERLAADDVKAGEAVLNLVVQAGQQLGRGGDGAVSLDPVMWSAAAGAQLSAYQSLERTLLDDITLGATDRRAQADSQTRLYLIGSVGAIIVSLGLAFVVARATTRPLRRLTSAAYELSTEQLPDLVERLRQPGGGDATSLAASLPDIDIDGHDEIGQLATAFNAIRRTTIEVAEEQASLLRKGISDIFVNLARRNQSLLDRQIEYIDQLESDEDDPESLEHLFKLDHLATRMRRNAESLLVLAGAEPPRRRGRPVPLGDVLRVALGEIEDFARIDVIAADDGTLGGNVAVDIAHLLAELLENATQFSPPTTRVEMAGHRQADGYLITVTDQGIGMTAEDLAEANHVLADPPLVGLALSRSLGFTVIGRLAARLGVRVRLTASPTGGVVAGVFLPSSVLADEFANQAVSWPAPGERPDRPDGTGTRSAPPPRRDPLRAAPVGRSVPAAPAKLADAVPSADVFEAGLAALMGDAADAGRAADLLFRTPDTGPVPEAAGAPGSDLHAAPVRPAGLPQRTATAVPAPPPVPPRQPAADRGASALPRRQPQVDAGAGEEVAVAASGRSPEEIRQMLSRYRGGLARGRSGESETDTDPGTGANPGSFSSGAQ